MTHDGWTRQPAAVSAFHHADVNGWDAQLAAACSVLAHEHERYIAKPQPDLQAENEALKELVMQLRQRLSFHEGRAAETLRFRPPAWRVEL